MKAIVYSRYGGPDDLQLIEVETPAPRDDEALIKVYAAAANPLDYHLLKGLPLPIRLVMPLLGRAVGVLRPNNPRLGADLAGRVEAVGRAVTRFRPGDEVFGACTGDKGAFAEFACATEERLALKPKKISYEQAACAPVAAVTALQGLRDKGRIQAGQKVLVNGASGGVGTFALQIAKALGAEVTAVCSASKLDAARRLGADDAIDYAQHDFTKSGRRWDLIYDVVGNHSIADYKRALAPGGSCVIAGWGFPIPSMSRLFEHMVLAPLMPKAQSKRVGSMGIANINSNDLSFIGDLMEKEQIKPVIDRRFPLRETADAIRYLGEGHARGKVVIAVDGGV